MDPELNILPRYSGKFIGEEWKKHQARICNGHLNANNSGAELLDEL